VRVALALLLAASAATAGAQGVVVGERATTGDAGPLGYADLYGEPLNASLGSLSTYLAELSFRPVRTTGRLERTRDGDYFKITDSLDQVLLVLVEEIEPQDLMRYMGMQVEVVGLARELPEKQRVGDCLIETHPAPESKCREWNLPPLPDRLGRADWPLNSVTVWEISDATPLEHQRRRDGGGLRIEDVLAEPERFLDREVTLTGRFRGANLFEDLPAESRRKESDWVIEDSGAALWVTGKKPEGRGFKLDPASESDGRWWIRVRGRIRVRDGVPVLDADKLELRPGPG